MKQETSVCSNMSILGCLFFLSVCSTNEPIDPCIKDTNCESINRKCIVTQGSVECGGCLVGFYEDAETFTCIEEIKLHATDAQMGDWFGLSVSISGDIAIVGAPLEDIEGYPNSGAAYIFQLENGKWSQKQKLYASDPHYFNDNFGISVSIDGNLAIVGAHWLGGGAGDTVNNGGAAYIFQLENGEWVEKQKITASDVQSQDHFGSSVSLSGDIAIIGAFGEDGGDSDLGKNAGAAYIFQLENGEWVKKQRLTASDAQSYDLFGYTVSISGDVAMVGAIDEDGGDGDSKNSAGAAYIFQLNNGMWEEKTKLTASDAQAYNGFGASVSISEDVAIVGAALWYSLIDDPDNDDGPGAAYIYRLENEDWVEKAKLTASDADRGDGFGSSVSISGAAAIIGAGNEGYSAGAAYIFQLEDGEWNQKQKLVSSFSKPNTFFGVSVAISRDIAIVGAWGEDGGDKHIISSAGAAYIYSR